MAFSFWAGLASGWLALAFLPSWLLGLIGFGWLWAGLAFTVLAFCGWFFAGLALSFGFLPSWLWAGLAFCFCRVGFGLDWVGFGLAALLESDSDSSGITLSTGSVEYVNVDRTTIQIMVSLSDLDSIKRTTTLATLPTNTYPSVSELHNKM